ncbi:phosphate signaling complex protein PhoU [Agaribacterium haliotis]|uniref:phosphate signaling complex protein PhoU n=1 Tax=Agaribacterium haliotis TaxID=2013869 RepID=UPI000BB58348|nr:phosphate signaling complex protein PhoU [Agaribacterium haliotis]
MDTLHLDQHISAQFNEDLEHLRTKLLEMGGLVEDQLKDAVKAIETADGALAEKVIETEKEVDQREMALDQESITILARRQPAASDLRLVMMVTKATRDLERVGDEANKIAKMAIALNAEGSDGGRGYVELRHLAANVIRVLNTVLDAFARYDVESAMDVVREDKIIDTEYKSAVREMITYMMEDPRAISRVMNIMWALRALERIGDHARNIAEQVIYLVHGTDVRHISIGDIERALESKR